MNSKATKTLVISAIVVMLALVTVTLVYAHSNRAGQQSADFQHNENHRGMTHEECEEFMEEQMHTDEAYDEHHGMMHGETEDSSDGWHGCH